ncbi:hypothetical protein PtrM4_108690 [Pyrenophora tritici-repentis]|uniref:Uncharacterized protein n=1 Tax=Pyrenophora tritici-repentis TaxID=45151 RepID=A0A834RW67_9PLEO|nr:hypothetical protein PtrM4_108690 [Pyrenophora tritici-repentis]KAI1514238.1 hypothetical protein Ptr86124_006868 [Pyrenophora tritici-repentis]KAI1666802.1 hypothetical protein L13192_09046 [Pyrenophora tritici-repentis]KAI1682640.1 hypothetical protein KJE20_07372 [Pyrenophora tritici-repentis]
MLTSPSQWRRQHWAACMIFRKSTNQAFCVRSQGARDWQGYRYLGRITIPHQRELGY